MEIRNNTLIIDKINSTSENKKIFDWRIIFPGNSSVIVSDKKMKIKIKEQETPENLDIKEALTRSILKAKPDSVLVSGGIDSSVLAAIAITKFKGIKLISAGTKDCEDSIYAEALSNELKTPLNNVVIIEENLYHAIRELKALSLDTYSIIMGITEFLSIEKAKTMKCSRLISGIGSDELFFGFNKHKTLKKEELKEFRDSRLFYMNALDLWRLNSISSKFNISTSFPYLDDEVIEAVLSKNIEDIAKNYDKIPVRSIGKTLGLSGKITERKKKAMQYGSGTVKLIRDLSKKNKYENVGEFIKGI
jgi:asparagine synthase (glutamine-hydrolysing)